MYTYNLDSLAFKILTSVHLSIHPPPYAACAAFQNDRMKSLPRVPLDTGPAALDWSIGFFPVEVAVSMPQSHSPLFFHGRLCCNAQHYC